MTKYNTIAEWDYFDSLQEGLYNAFDKKYNLYMLFLKKEGKTAKKQEPELMYVGMTTATIGDRLISRHDALKALLRDFNAQPITIALGKIKAGGVYLAELNNDEDPKMKFLKIL